MPAPLRIYREGESAGLLRSPRTSRPQPRPVDSYVQRLLKLIPTEVVSAYLVGREIAKNNDYSEQWALWCLLFTVVFRTLMTYEKSTEDSMPARLAAVQWPAVIIAMVSFAIWVFSFGEKFPAPMPALTQWQATLFLLIWTPLIPYLYEGVAPTRRPRLREGSSRGGRGVTAELPKQSMPSPTATAPRSLQPLPRRVTKDVIGKDERRAVAQTDQFPFSSIVLLHAFHGQESVARKMGTGWFVRPNVVVTAAHVVYDEAAFGEDGFADEVWGWPGYDNSRPDSNSFTSADIVVHPDYVQSLSLKSDVAIIKLSTDIVDSPLDISPAPPADKAPISVTGYPADKGGLQMFTCDGSVVSVQGSFAFYNSDTENGESGAPVMDGNNRVVAVHIDGKQYSGHLAEDANLGVRLHIGIVNWLQRFI